MITKLKSLRENQDFMKCFKNISWLFVEDELVWEAEKSFESGIVKSVEWYMEKYIK